MNLDNWLIQLEKIHPLAMDFKLERIRSVFNKMACAKNKAFIITVAGTNGKGSTSTTIATLLQSVNIKVGLYTSPHLIKFNERISINSIAASDDLIVEAFEAIEKARADITLTYFEFATLAAFYIFDKENVDVMVLEVGLGGRLDATNIVDADIAVITPIGIDHTAQLGHTLSEIAGEKAGIIKNNSIVVSAEQNPEAILQATALQKNATFYHLGNDFNYTILDENHWNYTYKDFTYRLKKPNLYGKHQYQNSATAITALLNSPFNQLFNEEKINTGLKKVTIAGRFQKIEAFDHTFYFDVTHNEQGAQTLQLMLDDIKQNNHNITAVLGMLKDKDPIKVISPLVDYIDHWIFASLDGDRGQTAYALCEKVEHLLKNKNLTQSESVKDACEKSINICDKNDIILVFGSFHTVSEGLDWINNRVNIND